MIVFVMTNKHNAKMYIGCTTELLKRRINTLFQASKKMTKASILAAIRKYGINGFKFSVLWEEDCTHIYECNCKVEMLEIKKVYVNYFNSMVFGYNQVTGGKRSPDWINPLKGISRTEEVKEKLRITGKINYRLHPEKFIAFKIQQKSGNIDGLRKWHKTHPNAFKGENNPNYKHGKYCK